MSDKNASDNDKVELLPEEQERINKEIAEAVERAQRRQSAQPIIERDIIDEDKIRWLIRRTSMPSRKDFRRFYSLKNKRSKKKRPQKFRRKHYTEYGRDEEE